MSNIYYGGVPVEQVNFQEESQKELSLLLENIKNIQKKLEATGNDSTELRYWTIKMHDANKKLAQEIISIN